jgi:hypothetical protein
MSRPDSTDRVNATIKMTANQKGNEAEASIGGIHKSEERLCADRGRYVLRR